MSAPATPDSTIRFTLTCVQCGHTADWRQFETVGATWGGCGTCGYGASASVSVTCPQCRAHESDVM